MKQILVIILLGLCLISSASAGQLNMPYTVEAGVDNITFTVDGQPSISIPRNSSIFSLSGVFPFSYADNVTLVPVFNGSCEPIINLTCPDQNITQVVNVTETCNVTQIINISQILNITGSNITNILCNNSNTYNYTYYNNYNNFSSNGIIPTSVCPAVTLTPTACNCNNDELTKSVASLTAKVEACSTPPSIQSAVVIPPSTNTFVPPSNIDVKYFTDRPWLILIGVGILFFLWTKREMLKNTFLPKRRPPRDNGGGNPLSKQVIDDGVL